MSYHFQTDLAYKHCSSFKMTPFFCSVLLFFLLHHQQVFAGQHSWSSILSRRALKEVKISTLGTLNKRGEAADTQKRCFPMCFPMFMPMPMPMTFCQPTPPPSGTKKEEGGADGKKDGSGGDGGDAKKDAGSADAKKDAGGTDSKKDSSGADTKKDAGGADAKKDAGGADAKKDSAGGGGAKKDDNAGGCGCCGGGVGGAADAGGDAGDKKAGGDGGSDKKPDAGGSGSDEKKSKRNVQEEERGNSLGKRAILVPMKKKKHCIPLPSVPYRHIKMHFQPTFMPRIKPMSA